jgi:hypothetical protein
MARGAQADMCRLMEAKQGLGGRVKRSEQLPPTTMRLEPQSVKRGILDQFNKEWL